MAGFTVTCAGCGRVFSPGAERSLYDRAGRCYACSQCLERAQLKVPVFKPRSKAGTGLRIVFGILFILAAFSGESDGADVTVACLAIGLALLLWQFWPQLWGLVRQKQNHTAILKLQETYRAQEEKRRAEEAARPKLCPHCGATTSGITCEYCGMPLVE